MAEDTKTDIEYYTGDPEEDNNYKGLANHGATCYMNSLLQAMYMTKEFRKALYAWKFDDAIQNKEDSIPYQLQKLFARLQLVDDAATTTDLTKSFGWDENQSFEQNDVQEFCRVLFEAINTTFEGTDQASMISDLYDGILTDTVNCSSCGYDSGKEVRFNDISLTIKDDFSNVFNDSLEKALAHYLHIEKLEGDNQYACSGCNKKVDATKGFRLIKLPRILCFNFNRFTLDYTTFSRVKINDKVTFPLILNMNPFLREYKDEEIEKLIQDNPLAKVRPSDLRLGKFSHEDGENDKDKEEITNETSQRFDKFMKTELENLEDQGEQETEGQTAIKRRKEQEEQERIHKENLKKLKKNITKKKGGFNRKNLNSNFFANSKNKANEVKGWAFDFGVEESCVVSQKPANATSLPGESEKMKEERQKQKEEMKKKKAEEQENPQENKPPQEDQNEADKDQDEDDEKTPSGGKKKIERKSKEEWAKIVKTQNDQLQAEYLKEGSFVYELYAILIHSGGAHAGHYYAYIKDSANNQWYKFNDVMVYKISFLEIISTFGQNPTKKKRFSSSVQNRANAYMLMYRQTDSDFTVNHVPQSLISQELQDDVKSDVKEEKAKLQEKERNNNQMQIKVICNDESKAFWVNRKEDPLHYLLTLAVGEFGLQEIGIENCRLRAYNIVNKVMQETYTDKENESFEKLSIFPLKTLALETKNPDETFEEYDPNQIVLKVNVWRRGFTVLDEENLQPTRIKISKEESMEDLMKRISKQFEISYDHLRIFKRRAVGQGKNVEELSLKKNMSRKLKILRINDGLNLFVENGSYEHPDIEKYSFLSSESTDNKWETEFELDRNRFTIKFNVPTDEEDSTDKKDEKSTQPELNIDYKKQVILDKRMTVFDLKAAISKELNIGLEELIFKRGAHGTEIKEDDLTLKAASLYNMICLYIKKGIPSHENEKRLKFLLADFMEEDDHDSLDPASADSIYYKMRELIEIPVNTHRTTFKVKQFVCEKINEKCQLDLDPSLIRFRERANDRLTKLFRDDVILEQYKMFEGKHVAIQRLKEPENIDPDSIIVMFRCWNPSTWELSPMREIIVKRYSTLDDFSNFLTEQYPFISRENMECCKVISNFFRIQLPYEKWYGLKDNVNFMASNPFYLSTDGLLMILKDKTQVERELTEAEKKLFGCDEFDNVVFSTKGGKRGPVPQEKSIKINVKKKMKKDPFGDAFEVLMPDDKPKENGKEEDVDMKDTNGTHEINGKHDVNSTIDTTGVVETNGDVNPQKLKTTLNGTHTNGASKDVEMSEEA